MTPRRPLPILLAALLMASCTQSPGPERMAGTAATLDGKVYLMGGLDSSGRMMSSVAEYDPSTATWTGKAPLPQAVALAAAAATDEAVYVLGGRSSSGILADVVVYDPAMDSWSQSQPLTTARWSHMAAVVGQKLYVMGGIAGTGDARRALHTVEVLDLETGACTPGPAMPRAVHSAAVAVEDGRIYILGGRHGTGSSGSASGQVVVLDPESGEWSSLAPMATPRSGARAVAFQGKIYVVGGAVADDALSSVEVYDPAGDSWQAAPPMSSPRTAHTAAVVGDDLLVFGGAASSARPRPLSEIEVIQLGGGGG